MRAALPLRFLILAALPLALGGCLVSAAKTIITAPIKAAEVVYDTATESQEEADIKRGRILRKQEEAAERKAKRTRRDAERAQRAAERTPQN